MKLRPSCLSLACSRKKKHGGTNREDDPGVTTQDGTLDRYGSPASRSRTGTWKGAGFTLVLQTLTNTAYFAVSINLVTYLTTIMHQNTASAVKNVSNWNGTGWLSPLVVGIIADGYSGRFNAAVTCCFIFIAGGAMLTIAASVSSLHPAQCDTEDFTCEHASLGQAAFFYVGLYTVAVGSAGVQGTMLPLGADQFDEEDEKELKQKASFFNWFYQAGLLGSLMACTFFVYIEDNFSWGIGWGLACGLQVLGTFVFLAGVRYYRHHPTGGNPLARLVQVGVAAFRKRGLKYSGPQDLYEDENTHSVSRKVLHSDKFRFLDKAAILTPEDKQASGPPNPWQLCTITQVEELKFLLRVIPIFCTSIMYTTCYNQLSTLFVTQGYSMDRNLGGFQIPAASLSVFESLSVVFWTITYDRVLLPFLRKRTGNPRGITTLKRMGIGLFLSVVAMTLAAGVAIERLRLVRKHGLQDDTETPVPMSVFWEVPQYFVMGASEVFTYVGLLEFFYDQAPDAIRTVGSSLSLLTYSLGSFVASLLVTIVNRITKRNGSPGWIADSPNRGRTDLFFWLLAALSTLNLLAFIISAHYYENTVTEGPIGESAEERDAKAIHDDKDEQRISHRTD